MQSEREDWVSEAIILVGDIPCPIARHTGDPAGLKVQERLDQQDEPEGTRVKLKSRIGREIVGPSYSKEPTMGGLSQHDLCTQRTSTWGARHYYKMPL
jgi:hypothetical protein